MQTSFFRMFSRAQWIYSMIGMRIDKKKITCIQPIYSSYLIEINFSRNSMNEKWYTISSLFRGVTYVLYDLDTRAESGRPERLNICIGSTETRDADTRARVPLRPGSSLRRSTLNVMGNKDGRKIMQQFMPSFHAPDSLLGKRGKKKIGAARFALVRVGGGKLHTPIALTFHLKNYFSICLYPLNTRYPVTSTIDSFLVYQFHRIQNLTNLPW